MGDFVFTLLSKKKRYSPINESVYMMLYGRRKNKVYMKRFSIIIPVYNVAPYLRECLDSVLKQTFADWEAICVDDGSTDESGAILDEYAAKDKRFRAVHKRNGGEGSARNAGIDLAKGEWICYIDSDDIWHKSYLEEVNLVILKERDIDMIGVRQQDFNDGMECVWENKRSLNFEVFETRDFLDARLFGISSCSTVYKYDIFGGLRFTHHCLGADRIHIMRCLSRSKRAAIISNQNYGYRIRENSMAHNAWTRRKVLSAITFSRECVLEMASCSKVVQRCVARGLCSLWFERNPVLILSIKDPASRKALLKKWIEGMPNRLKGRFFPLWYRFLCRLLQLTKGCRIISVMCVIFFCVFPYKIKTKGFHR